MAEDYISREAAIRAVGASSWAGMRLADIPAANVEEIGKPKWIPVTERMPEIMDTVIVSGRMKYEWETDFIQFVDVATYGVSGLFETFNDWYEGQDYFQITHWMPLPEQPSYESKDS